MMFFLKNIKKRCAPSVSGRLEIKNGDTTKTLLLPPIGPTTDLVSGQALPIPELETVTVTTSGGGKPFVKAPLPGPVGEWIAENILSDAWEGWIAQGTKVINELRLDFSREEDQQVYEDYMAEFLSIPKEIIEKDRTQKEKAKQS